MFDKIKFNKLKHNVLKHYTDVQPGDVALLMYGAVDNYIKVAVKSIHLNKEKTVLQVEGRQIHNGEDFVGYVFLFGDPEAAMFEVIGKIVNSDDIDGEIIHHHKCNNVRCLQ
jgi:hypothetical protein